MNQHNPSNGLFHFIKVFVLSALLAGGIMGCKKSGDSGTNGPHCQVLGKEILTPLHTDVAPTPGQTTVQYSTSEKIYYNFNAGRQLASIADLVVDSFETGKTRTANTLTTYEYNGAFLARLENHTTTVDTMGVQTMNVLTLDYLYGNDRLIKQTFNTLNGQQSNTYSLTYEYDGAGHVVKYSKPTGTMTYTYTNGTLTQAVSTKPNGDVITSAVGLDTKGRLTHVVTGQLDQRYIYNSTGDLTHMEEWSAGKPLDASDLSYDDKPNPLQTLDFPPFKGLPNLDYVQLQPYALLGNNLHNLVKTIAYKANPSGDGFTPWQTYTNNTHYNSQGYPDGWLSFFDTASPGSSGRTIIWYEGCN